MVEKTLGLKISVGLNIVSAILNLILPVLAFIAFQSLPTESMPPQLSIEDTKYFSYLFLGIGALFGIAYASVAYFLWKLSNNARYAALILSVFGLGFGFLDLFSGSLFGVVVLLWNGLIIYFLFLDQKTKDFFIK